MFVPFSLPSASIQIPDVHRLRNLSRQCTIKTVYFEYGFETTAIVFFLVPITIISVLYILIGIELRKSSNQIKNDSSCGGGGGTPKEILTQGHNNNLIVVCDVDQPSSAQQTPDNKSLYQRHNSVSSSHQKQIASRRSVIRMLGKHTLD